MVFENYVNAGKIASMVRENARKKIILVELCLKYANLLKMKLFLYGGSPAFPVNVSLNEIAARLYR